MAEHQWQRRPQQSQEAQQFGCNSRSRSSKSPTNQEYIRMANDLLANLDLPGRVRSLRDIGPGLLVQLYESICCDCLPGLLRPAATLADLRHNLAAVLDSLANDVLHVSLSHIQPDDLISGDRLAVGNLIEIFHGLLEFLLTREGPRPATVEPPAPPEEGKKSRRGEPQPAGHQERKCHVYHHFSPSLAAALKGGKPQCGDKQNCSSRRQDAATSPLEKPQQQRQQQQHFHPQMKEQICRIAQQAAEVNELARRLVELRTPGAAASAAVEVAAASVEAPPPTVVEVAAAAAELATVSQLPLDAGGDTSDEGIVQDRSPCETRRPPNRLPTNAAAVAADRQHPQQQQRRSRRLRPDHLAWVPQPTPPPPPPPQQQQQRLRRRPRQPPSAAAGAAEGRLALLANLLAREREQLQRREVAHERLLRSLAGNLLFAGRRSRSRRQHERADFAQAEAVEDEDEDSIIELLSGSGGGPDDSFAAF